VYLDAVVFEVNLKVKGESEDKETLIHQNYWYNGSIGSRGRSCSNKLCKINLNYMELPQTVQATITSIQIFRGSWPSIFAGQVFCQDGTSPEKFTLLDFPNGMKPPVDQDGNLYLSRRVVSVHVRDEMTLTVRAYSRLTESDSKCDVVFAPQRRGVTVSECDFDGQCLLKIKVAWSLLAVIC
jgi:hypothetical protein